jgi:hypothetical protein
MSFSVRNNQKKIVSSPSTTPDLSSYLPNYWSENTGNIIYNNTLPSGKVGINSSAPIYTFDVSTTSVNSMRIQSSTNVGIVYERYNNNVNLTNGTDVYVSQYSARRSGGLSGICILATIYNGDGTTRRGKVWEGCSAGGSPFPYQRAMTQVGTNKINIIGENSSSYIDDAVNPNTAYNMHASNIINALSGGTLGLLSLDIDGITNHKFFLNGNVTFGGTSNNSKAIVDISSTTKGFMPPRMTGEQVINNISPGASEAGLIVYATSTFGAISAVGWWGWDGATWRRLDN